MKGFHRTFKPVLLVLIAVFLLQPSTASAFCPDPTVDALITAINAANNDTAPKMHAINLFPQTTYELSLPNCQLPPFTSGIKINGNGATIDGSNSVRPLFVAASGDLTLNDVIVARGHIPGAPAGGIWNTGTLTLINSTVTRNFATDGGGILNNGTLTLINSSVDHNTAATIEGNAHGGGIWNTGTVNLIGNSSVDHNIAIDGPGIYNTGFLLPITATVNISGNSKITDHSGLQGGGITNNGGTVNIFGNGSITGNTALRGGGILNNGTVNISGNGSVTGNRAILQGGGIYNSRTVNISGSGSDISVGG